MADLTRRAALIQEASGKAVSGEVYQELGRDQRSIRAHNCSYRLGTDDRLSLEACARTRQRVDGRCAQYVWVADAELRHAGRPPALIRRPLQSTSQQHMDAADHHQSSKDNYIY